MPLRRVSISDLARELNVAPSTVSRALRDEPRISIKTRQRIKKLAEKYGYRPNSHAVSLVKQQSFTWGIVIPQIVHPYFSNIISGINSVAASHQYQTILSVSDEQSLKEKAIFKQLYDAHIDGMLVVHTCETMTFEHFAAIQRAGIPLVFIDRHSEEIEAPYVISDDFSGAKKAVQYLLNCGRTNIGHIHGPEHISTSFNRFMGYREALKSAGQSINAEWIFQTFDDLGKQFADKEALARQLPDLDAIFAFNDFVAYEVMQIAFELGLRIPEDLAIIGFCDAPIATHTRPQLTTVRQPAFEIGVEAAKLLYEYMPDWELNEFRRTRDSEEYVIKVLDTELIIRGTTP